MAGKMFEYVNLMLVADLMAKLVRIQENMSTVCKIIAYDTPQL